MEDRSEPEDSLHLAPTEFDSEELPEVEREIDRATVDTLIGPILGLEAPARAVPFFGQEKVCTSAHVLPSTVPHN